MILKGDPEFWPEAVALWLEYRDRLVFEKTALLIGTRWRAWYRAPRFGHIVITTEKA